MTRERDDLPPSTGYRLTKIVNSRFLAVRRLPVTRLPAHPDVVAQSSGQEPVGRGSAAEISVWPGCGNGSAGVLEMLPGRAHRACVVPLGGVGAHVRLRYLSASMIDRY